MCREIRVTAGAMLVGMLGPRVILTTASVAGSGVALYAVAGTALTAWLIMVLAGGWAITLIVVLARRANPLRETAPAPSSRAPQRAHAQILSRRVRALPAPAPHITHAAEQYVTEER